MHQSQIVLAKWGDWIEVCYLPEDAFSLDPVKRDAVFIKEMELYSLLAEIASMVGIPKIDVDILQRQAPNKGLYNDYKKGMEELRKIVENERARFGANGKLLGCLHHGGRREKNLSISLSLRSKTLSMELEYNIPRGFRTPT